MRCTIKTFGNEPWLKMVLHFAGVEASGGHPNGTTTYFEEHVTHPILPEFVVHRDEWVDDDFCRYRAPADWRADDHYNYWNSGGQTSSANSPAYRDFAVYYADQ